MSVEKLTNSLCMEHQTVFYPLTLWCDVPLYKGASTTCCVIHRYAFFCTGIYRSGQQAPPQVFDGSLKFKILGYLPVYLLDGVNDGGVVLAAKFFADLGIG